MLFGFMIDDAVFGSGNNVTIDEHKNKECVFDIQACLKDGGNGEFDIDEMLNITGGKKNKHKHRGGATPIDPNEKDRIFKHIQLNSSNPCLDPNAKICSISLKKELEQFAIENALNPTDTRALSDPVEIAKEVTKCDTELCVLNSGKFKDFVNDSSKTDKAVEIYFKAPGPAHSEALLSNYNIDNSLMRWARTFEFFFPFTFAMSDTLITTDPIATTDLIDVYNGDCTLNLNGDRSKRVGKCVGCIVNTDISSGGGKHWTAVFVDMRDENHVTVEYFNSVANPPFKNMILWLQQTKLNLQKKFKNVEVVSVVTVDHQQGDSECGVYSLYYIRSRLEGKPYTFFEGAPISDSAMIEFRKYLFR